MKCKSCGYDVEVIGFDHASVQAVMLENPCCEKPDYSAEAAEEVMFAYLDELWDSGVTNMFGAGLYLMHEFNLSKSEAGTVLAEWMRTLRSGTLLGLSSPKYKRRYKRWQRYKCS